MPEISTGRALLTVTSLTTMCGCYLADWNETHIHNPDWPPHAKFHNAQTMSFGAALGAVGLWALWGHRRGGEHGLRLATGAASLYWITQMSALLYPDTKLADPPRPPGKQPVVAGACLALNALAYGLERRRTRRRGR